MSVASGERGGITPAGEGLDGIEWNVLGQTYRPKAEAEGCFAFESVVAPGQFCPVHVHTAQDEFILLVSGTLRVKLAGVWDTLRPGDLLRTPRGVSLGYYNDSDEPARALFWISPPGRLREMFEAQDGMTDIEMVEASAQDWGVTFLEGDLNE